MSVLPPSLPEPASITCEELTTAFLTNAAGIVPVDVRPYSAFVISHIAGAVNVKLSAILIRRLAAGKISVEDLLQEDGALFRSRGDGALLVVYDDKATLGGDQDTKTIVLNALRKAGYRTAFLSASFMDFSAASPTLTEASETVAPASTLAAHVPMAPKDSPAKVKIINLEPTEIIPNLYIGAKKDALNIDTLTALGVAGIVNVTKDCPNAFPDQIEYLQIPIDDHWSQDLIAHLDRAAAFIERFRSDNKTVLVHCMAGISRSPSVTIAYIMRDRHLSLNDAYNFVKSKRPAISPHLDFLGELTSFEKRNQADAQSRSGSDEDSDTLNASLGTSSILFQNCPWLSLATATPEASSMDVDVPVTAGLQQRAPWAAEFRAANINGEEEGDMKRRDMERQTSSASSGISNSGTAEQAPAQPSMPQFVLQPVPRVRRFPSNSQTSSSNNTPAASPPPGAMPVQKDHSSFRRPSAPELPELDECVVNRE